MAFIRKIKASLVRKDLEDYVGEETYIFHDIVSGELRITDGTPGGAPIFVPGGGSDVAAIWGNITGTLSDQTDLQTALDSADDTALWGSITGNIVDQTDLQTALDNAEITVWGDIIGTLSDQTDLQAALDAKLEEEVFAQQIDFITDDLLYRGEAEPGTATSANLWRIRRITIDNAGEGDISTVWADGDNDFDNVWDDRLILAYS